MFCNNVPAGKSDKILRKFNKINFSALPPGFFRHFRLYPQFRGNAEKSPFLIFLAPAARRKKISGIPLFDVFERQLSGLPENAIRNYARSLFTHLFYAQTQKFWRCPNFPYISPDMTLEIRSQVKSHGRYGLDIFRKDVK